MMDFVPLLNVKSLCKSYAGVQALKGVDLKLEQGEVHGLVGENGAGKSTLIKILTGVVVPDSGEVEFLGSPLPFGSVRESEAAGISVVHQESTAFRDLGVEDNIFVGREPRSFLGLFLDRKSIRAQTTGLLRQIDIELPFDRPLRELSLAQQQMVAVARALSLQSRLLILDEPTASLSTRESDVLYERIRQLSASGVAVVLVSHRLEEVLDLCDNVTVLRDGSSVATRPRSDWTRSSLIETMVGRHLDERATRPSKTGGNCALRVAGLTRKDKFYDVSFQLAQGEVLGLGGLVGSGRSEVVEAVFGSSPADQGTVEVDGVPLKRGNVPEAIRHGVSLVPEDRQHQGLILELSIHLNLVMAARGSMSSAGWIQSFREQSLVSSLVSKLGIKTSSSQNPAQSLSGGNQQKVVIGKWLATEPKILILDEPTRGVDVGSKLEIHRLIRQLVDEGTAVLVVSSDLPELLALSDRILVMSSGRIAGELGPGEMSSENVLNLAFQQEVRK